MPVNVAHRMNYRDKNSEQSIGQRGSPLMEKKTAEIKKTTLKGQTVPYVALIVMSTPYIILGVLFLTK